jgi:hypothetical protein
MARCKEGRSKGETDRDWASSTQAMDAPEFKSRHSEKLRKLHADPAYGAKMIEANRTPEARAKKKETARNPAFRAKQAERARKQWADPEYRARNSEAVRKAMSDPRVKAKVIEGNRKKSSNPAFKAKQSENARKQWMSSKLTILTSRLSTRRMPRSGNSGKDVSQVLKQKKRELNPYANGTTKG